MYSHKKMSLITAILPMSTTMPIIRELHAMGIYTANKSTARGSSSTSQRHDVEMEVMTVLVEEAKADEVFGLVYERGGLDKPSHGMIFQSAVSLASEYTLPSE
ncbi:MAG: hypothetical protein AB7D29_01110 [Campylobacterales bacterium]